MTIRSTVGCRTTVHMTTWCRTIMRRMSGRQDIIRQDIRTLGHRMELLLHENRMDF
jgi:hypothetical protein